MRKIIVHIASSADGFIARPDGDVKWLDRPQTAGDYGMAAFYKTIDTVVMGRKTHDIAVKLGQPSYPGKKNFVFSRTKRASGVPNVEMVNADPGEFARRLRRTKGKNIWLVGGAELNAALLDAGQVDEFVIHIVPFVIGEGIPLIHPRQRNVPLELLSSERFPDGVIGVHYRVAT